MIKFTKIVGYVWTSPLTLFGLMYVMTFTCLKWYNWHSVQGDGLVWTVNACNSPSWLTKLWERWSGHAIGNVVVLKREPSYRPTTLVHELKHVNQCMRLGIFQPIVYVMCYLAIKFGCPGSNPYSDCIFEIDARRAAGQVVDVSGALKILRRQNPNNS
jgi:hypothetical protein